MCCTVCSDTFLKIKAAQTILDISITINETSPIHNRRVVIAHCIDEPSTLQLSNTPTIIKSSHQQTYLNPLAATYGSSCRCLLSSLTFVILLKPLIDYITWNCGNIHKACAAVSLANASFTSNFFTKSLALALTVGHGLSRKSGFFFSTWSSQSHDIQ